jgi:hypothetical protein
MEFGQVINPTYDPSKNHVYESFSAYFKNPVMTKIKDVKLSEKAMYSVYMVKIRALLGNAFRYLILFVDKDDNSIKTNKYMNDCEWISLQTRTLEENHSIATHSYQSVRKPPMNQKISIKTRDDKKSIYNVDKFPLEITLLHTRKNHSYQYNPNGTIASALETFQTIVNFNK